MGTAQENSQQQEQQEQQQPATIVICGAGIVGLVLALGLKKHLGIIAEVYEKAHAFHDDVGAALGMYPNGLRVLRDINPFLMEAVTDQGYAYLYRRWERHDGTEIATAKEDVLTGDDDDDDEDLCSIGIRRWKLQKVLYDAVIKENIPVHFSKAACGLIEHDHNELIEVLFEDGTSRFTELLFGVDGGKSVIRQIVADPTVQLSYTGVTCLMGIADCPSPVRGISFPSSMVSNFHAVYFPTGPNEQCFQIHFPIDEDHADKSNWGNLSKVEGQEQFNILAKRMKQDGWHERYIEPLSHVEHAVKVGFALLNPRLDRWVYGKHRRIILVGDAAHPPVPYVGQGAQMGVEDAGTICLLLKHLCTDDNGNFKLKHIGEAGRIYEKIRIPRTSKILDISKSLGMLQDIRSHDTIDAELRELYIIGEVMMNDTLPAMFPGATYDYKRDVMTAIVEEKVRLSDLDLFDDLIQKAEQLFEEIGY